MKIVADDKIPFLKGVLEPFADVVYVPGKAISREYLLDADALLTRTRTRCNKSLLENTPVKFIGTATIGFDHIDTAWCEHNGIVWKNAPGCNASSVNQYIASALVNLSRIHGFNLKNKTLGVVGAGHVGSRVVHTAEQIGMRVYRCDPPRVRDQGACGFISLEGIIRECDIITFHVPLNKTGIDKTYHMINDELLGHVNPGTIIINTSRGEVADGDALKKAIRDKTIGGLVLDVWENEPDIDLALLELCDIATPHIAGYSADGKARGTAMIIDELSRHFDLGITGWEPNHIPEPANSEIRINCQGMPEEDILKTALLSTYDVLEDDQKLRMNPADFEQLRGDYPPRREFKAFALALDKGTDEIKHTCRNLGFNVL